MGYQNPCGTTTITTPYINYRITLTGNGSGEFNALVEGYLKQSFTEHDFLHCVIEITDNSVEDPEISAINQYLTTPTNLNTWTTLIDQDIPCAMFFNTPLICQFRVINNNTGNAGAVEKQLINFTTDWTAPGRYHLFVHHRLKDTECQLYIDTYRDNIRNGATITLADYISGYLEPELFRYDHAEVNGVTTTTLTCLDESDEVVLYYASINNFYYFSSKAVDLGTFNGTITREIEKYTYYPNYDTDGMNSIPYGFIKLIKFTTDNMTKSVTFNYYFTNKGSTSWTRPNAYIITSPSLINVSTGIPSSYIATGEQGVIGVDNLSANTTYYLMLVYNTSVKNFNSYYINYIYFDYSTTKYIQMLDGIEYYPRQRYYFSWVVPKNCTFVLPVTVKKWATGLQFAIDMSFLTGDPYLHWTDSIQPLDDNGFPVNYIADIGSRIIQPNETLYAYVNWHSDESTVFKRSFAKISNPNPLIINAYYVSTGNRVNVYSSVVDDPNARYGRASLIGPAFYSYEGSYDEIINRSTDRSLNQYMEYTLYTIGGSYSTPGTYNLFKGWYTNYNGTGTPIGTDLTFRTELPTNVYQYWAVFESATDLFEWDSPKTVGAQFVVTANEWNRLARIVISNSKRYQSYYNKNADPSLYHAEQGEIITAKKYNALATIINDQYSGQIQTVSKGDEITAARLNALKDTINAWIRTKVGS